MEGRQVEIVVIVCLEDMEAGDEVTTDEKCELLSSGQPVVICECATGRCSGMVGYGGVRH